MGSTMDTVPGKSLTRKMAEGVETSLNEGALKRVDPYIKEILDTAKYVALYTFENEAWIKTKIEGSLFVYSRTAEPLYNILVLNRLDKKNLIEPITPEFDFQRSDPYLLYKNSFGHIYGIWFFDPGECIRLSELVQNLMKRSVVRPAQIQTNGQVDIFQMLTKAQEARINQGDGQPPPQRRQSESEATPQSVAEFFAKAGNGGEHVTIPKPLPVERDLSGLFQKLMTNPVHSVEHIERQQRVVTPLSADPAIKVDPLNQFLRPRSMDVNLSSFALQATANGSQATHADSHVTHPIGANGFSSQAVASTPPGFSALPSEEIRHTDLMPPAMFTPKEPERHRRACVPTQPAKEPEMCARQPPRAVTPEPLTRNQLCQALDYLLRNDSEFMTKIHEAYIKALTEKIL